MCVGGDYCKDCVRGKEGIKLVERYYYMTQLFICLVTMVERYYYMTQLFICLVTMVSLRSTRPERGGTGRNGNPPTPKITGCGFTHHLTTHPRTIPSPHLLA